MGGEFYALLSDLAKLGEREYLESAAIGEDGARPIHKFVESAHFIDELIAGTDVEVVGVGKLYLTAHLAKVLGGNTALDSRASAYVHKHGSLNIAVYGVEDASAGAAFLFQKFIHFKSS